MPPKIARPRPAAGEEEESIQRAAGVENFAAVLCKKASSTTVMMAPWHSQKAPESTQQKSNHWNVSGADGQREHVQRRSDHFIPHWAAARKRWRGHACTEAYGTRLRAKEAKKACPRRLKKCRPHRARPFGAGLERPHDRRDSPRAHERRPLL
jgi:hypothetical protein